MLERAIEKVFESCSCVQAKLNHVGVKYIPHGKTKVKEQFNDTRY